MSNYRNASKIYEKINSNQIEYKKVDYIKKHGLKDKPELLKPYLHSIDEASLQKGVKMFLYDTTDKETQKILAKYGYTVDEMKREIVRLYNKFPKSLINDIFNMNYKELSEIEFKEMNSSNKTRYAILNKSSDSISKVISENSLINSFILTRSFVRRLLYQLILQQDKNYDDFKDIMQDLKDNTEFVNSNIISKILNHPMMSKLEQNDQKNDLEFIEKLNDLVSKEKQDEMFNDISSDKRYGLSKYLEQDRLDMMHKYYEDIKMNIDAISKPIEKLLDKSLSYFSYKTKIEYEGLFDTDDFSGLEEWAYLHPGLKNTLLGDVQVKHELKQGKIDIYVDISGSMSAPVGIEKISKHIFSKSFLYKLFKKNILNSMYTFDTRIESIDNNIFDILSIECGGGTTINNVVQNITKTKKNSIILTDAQDSCSIYSEHCFFIGVNGSSFNMFKPGVLKQYKENNQIIVFDGKTAKYVK